MAGRLVARAWALQLVHCYITPFMHAACCSMCPILPVLTAHTHADAHVSCPGIMHPCSSGGWSWQGLQYPLNVRLPQYHMVLAAWFLDVSCTQGFRHSCPMMLLPVFAPLGMPECINSTPIWLASFGSLPLSLYQGRGHTRPTLSLFFQSLNMLKPNLGHTSCVL